MAMRNLVLNLAAGASATLLLAGAASAQMLSAVTADELQSALAAAGLSPTMAEDSSTGYPVAAGKIGEIVFWVRAIDCRGAPLACENLMFFANFDLGHEATAKDYVIINSYNDSKVFGRAYLIEAQSQVGVDYVIDLGGGVSMDHLTKNIARWTDVVAAFIEKFSAGYNATS